MTIKDLIQELSKLPQDSQILHAYEAGGNYHPYPLKMQKALLYKMDGQARILPLDMVNDKLKQNSTNHQECFCIF